MFSARYPSAVVRSNTSRVAFRLFATWVPFFVRAMNRKPGDAKPLTCEESKLLRSLLDRMSVAGREPGSEEFDLSEKVALGSMSDASKRRLMAESELMDGEFEHLEMPKSKYGGTKGGQNSQESTHQFPEKVELPPGISNLEDWGSTVCRLPKVKSLGLCYTELVDDPKTHQEYLEWILAHGSGRGGRLEDLYLFLKAIKYAENMVLPKDQLFPGTKEVREKKSHLG